MHVSTLVIGLVLLLLLPTPTIWLSLDYKRNVSDGVVSEIGTLFSPDDKLYASDYDSDSVASENHPLEADLVFIFFFAMCSADFTCVNGSTIQSVLRELLLTANVWFFE